MTIAQSDFAVLQEAAKVELARRNFAAYCDYVHGRPLYRHQEEWGRELLIPGAQTCIVAPPETYKSSTLRMFLEWYIGRNPECAILYIMNTSSQAQRQVMSIQSTIEKNPKYHVVFPGVIPDKARGWTKEQMFIQRENRARADATIYGTGIDGPYQGVHVDLLVVDDPTDQQDVRSETTMEQQRERVHGVLIDRLQVGGSIFVILTRWGEADLVRDFKDMGFNIVSQPLEGRYPWGRLLSPELFPDDRLRTIREQKGSAMYALTYLCDPSAASGSMVKRAWWKYYGEPQQIPRGMRIHSWDLSIGKTKTADSSAFGHWGSGEDGYYLLDAGKWQLTMDERLKKMVMLYELQRPSFILIEDAVPSMDFINYVQRHTKLPIKLIKPRGRDKVARLQGILPLIEAGRVWLPSQVPWLADYEDELSAFPAGAHDDYVDMTSQAIEYMDKRARYGTAGIAAAPSNM